MTDYPLFRKWLDDEFFCDLAQYKDDEFDQEINQFLYLGQFKYTNQSLIVFILGGNNSSSIEDWLAQRIENIPRFVRLNGFFDFFYRTIESLRARYAVKLANQVDCVLHQCGIKQTKIKLNNKLTVML